MAGATHAAGEGGVLLLDKPAGWSSTRALGRAKRLLGLRKGGHTGTLDPFATGLLPLVFGEATKFSRFLLDAPKAYVATLCLGRTSTTGDPEGQLSEQVAVSVDQGRIADVLGTFVGVQQQIPPMHSAVHHQGQRLYELARAGQEVVRPPRTIEIYSVNLVSIRGEQLRIDVKCSKGAYVRTLAEDIGKRLGCGAYLTELRRTAVAGFGLESAITLEALESAGTAAAEALLRPEVLVSGLPRLVLDQDRAQAICQGRTIRAEGLAAGDTALFGPGERFLGVGVADGTGGMAAERLLATAETVRLP